MKIFIVTSVLILAGLLDGCRVSPRQASPSLTQSQQELQSLISGEEKTAAEKPSLIGQVRMLFAEYNSARTGDSLPSDSLLETFLDSAVLELSSKLFMQRDPAAIVNALNHYIFDRRGIVFLSDRNNPHGLFPHLVIAQGRGSCVGMSLVYLLIGEKLNLPLYAVLAPGHCFVRYDDGVTRVNIETLRKGEAMPESWYRMRYNITDSSLYRLKNCTADQVAAIVAFNAGTMLYHEQHFGASVKLLRKAARSLGSYPEVNGNLALALDRNGKSEEAFRLLSAIRERYPRFEQIDVNIASVALKCGKDSVALYLYDSLATVYSRDPVLLYGKAVAQYRLGDTAACSTLLLSLDLDSSNSAARNLMMQIPCTKTP